MNIYLSAFQTDHFIFYILSFLSVAFVAFVFISRYITRNHEHNHDDNDIEDLL